mgnify:CR=1 FL=1
MVDQLDKISLRYGVSPKCKKHLKKAHARAKRREGKKLLPSSYNRYKGWVA